MGIGLEHHTLAAQLEGTTYYSLLTTHHSPLTTYYSPLTTHHSLLTTHYSLLYYAPWPHSSKARMRSAASMPDMPGMLMSISTRSYSAEKPSMMRT
jgi:hypothetical protein